MDEAGTDVIPARLIERKRDGEELTPSELTTFFEAYLAAEVSDYQMSAFLMAVVFRGLSAIELDALVDVMIGSGAVLDLSHLPGPRVDKHSTGGVGDKVSLVLAPLAAELGLWVPMMSGRGLGHTTGTLDKLEAIPGFRTDLDLDAFGGVLASVGCAMIGQTAEIAPLDRRLYDLRSVTGTVPCLPLIAASIMSKKLAEGLTGLVLDVKVGEGAFLPDEARALELARTMVRIGEGRNVPTTALVTAMDRPLGRAVGNALETAEAMACLAGEGPADVEQLVVELAAEMAVTGGVVEDLEEGRTLAGRALAEGRALERMERLVEAQGGDPSVVRHPERLPRAPEVAEVRSDRGGVVAGIGPLALGRAVVALGGGRARLGAEVDLRVGFVLRVSPGDAVSEGDSLAEVHAADRAGLELGRAAVADAVRLGAPEEPLTPLILHRIGGTG